MQDIRDILFKDLEGRQYWRDVACRMCMVEVDGTGRLVTSCNTGALTARDDTNRVLDALTDPEITTIVQVVPGLGGDVPPAGSAGHHRPYGQRPAADRL